MKQSLQSPDASPAEGVGALDRSHGGPDLASQGYPARLLPEHLMRIFDIKKARFYQLLGARRFDRFLLRPTIGRRAWSRTLVQRYLDGERVEERKAS